MPPELLIIASLLVFTASLFALITGYAFLTELRAWRELLDLYFSSEEFPQTLPSPKE